MAFPASRGGGLGHPPGLGRLRRYMMNALARSSGRHIDHLRDGRLQFPKAVADAEQEDDSRNRKAARVPFMRHPPVDCGKRGETTAAKRSSPPLPVPDQPVRGTA